MCRHKITKETGWNNHHIVERVKGGSDEPDNLVLLHPNCHRQLHSSKENSEGRLCPSTTDLQKHHGNFRCQDD
ncbi:HNH endonuclease [uncultured Pseudoalteromonas sp.]|uniref:HNH endonuclease n=1 Tax=uncultured Pseudoalteromonas sp. TaxID=114053 RepID=UPI0025D79E62|nr:HNH endonuclease [uncultured Pseudoalteromonas sp.]